jgi:hypothetical protein
MRKKRPEAEGIVVTVWLVTPITTIHGVRTHKITIKTFTAEKTSNPKQNVVV